MFFSVSHSYTWRIFFPFLSGLWCLVCVPLSCKSLLTVGALNKLRWLILCSLSRITPSFKLKKNKQFFFFSLIPNKNLKWDYHLGSLGFRTALVKVGALVTWSGRQHYEFWVALQEKQLLPENSHTNQGVARAPPKTLVAMTGVPLQWATPVSRWVPLLTHPQALILPSGLTLGSLKHNL